MSLSIRKKHDFNALYLFRSKMILVRFKLDFSGPIFIIWTRPKQIAPVQDDWYSTKIIWTLQNHFGPIEGQGIRGLWIMWIYEMLKFDN